MPLQQLGHENLSRTVYGALCDAIAKGKFRPGQRLKLRDLAEQLGTSVTPVRDAILLLAHDEAVVFQSPRDIRIPVLTNERYLEIRTLRLQLEGMAAANAARLATAQDLTDLDRLVSDNEQAMANGDGLLGSALNQQFHYRIMEIARMPTLKGILNRLWLQMGPLISDSYNAGGRDMIEYHYPLLDALTRKNPDAAAHAIQDDILHGGHVMAELIAHNAGGQQA